MNERNRALAEVLGFCWHRYKGIIIQGRQFQVCLDCGFTVPQGDAIDTYPDFSDGMWFMILHSHVKKNPKYMEFFCSEFNPYAFGEPITPDVFANCLYQYLMAEEIKRIIDEKNRNCSPDGDTQSGEGEGMVGCPTTTP